MDLRIAIVSWNCREELRGCLAALAADPPAGEYAVIVVDNASSDGTAAMVREQFPAVRLVANEDNRGFAAACNQALAAADARFLLLLNPDTAPAPGALDTLMAFMEAHPRCGACGPTLLNADGSLQPTGRPFPTLWREALDATGLRLLIPTRLWTRLEFGARDFDSEEQVDELRGACLLIRREAWEQVGPLDEQFFLFYEEVDWCRRVRDSGWQVWHVPRARVTHRWMASVERSGGAASRYFYQSQARYFAKHHGPLAAAIARGIGAIGRARGRFWRFGSRAKQWLRRRLMRTAP